MSRGLVFTPEHLATLRGWLAEGRMTRAEIAEALGVTPWTVSKRAAELGYGFNTAARRAGKKTYRIRLAPAKAVEPVEDASASSDLAARYGVRLVAALAGVPKGAGEYAALRKVAQAHGRPFVAVQQLLHRVRAS